MDDPARPLIRTEPEVRIETSNFAARLERLALDLFRTPEPALEERRSVARLVGELQEEGFELELGLCGLPTAFRAERCFGPGGVTVALLAEYDAIPGSGHSAGHHLLCMATIEAATLLSRDGFDNGRLVVLGAPAEETIGGKVVLALGGAFDGIDAALLAHPGTEERVQFTSLACWSLEVLLEGKAAHAVAAPHLGINALDAMIQLFAARDVLLKSLLPSVRIPGVILEGGVRANLIPDRCRARFSLRADSTHYLVETVARRFQELVEGVARATGVKAAVRPIDNLYDDFAPNRELARLWSRAWDGAERPLAPALEIPWSLDAGTISHLLPTLHPFFAIAAEPLATHTEAFRDASISPSALSQTHRAAQALRAVAATLFSEPQAIDAVRAAQQSIPAPFDRATIPLIRAQESG